MDRSRFDPRSRPSCPSWKPTVTLPCRTGGMTAAGSYGRKKATSPAGPVRPSHRAGMSSQRGAFGATASGSDFTSAVPDCATCDDQPHCVGAGCAWLYRSLPSHTERIGSAAGRNTTLYSMPRADRNAGSDSFSQPVSPPCHQACLRNTDPPAMRVNAAQRVSRQADAQSSSASIERLARCRCSHHAGLNGRCRRCRTRAYWMADWHPQPTLLE